MSEVTHLYAALSLVRKRVSKDMPIQQVVLLLLVAERPGITMPELMQALDMPQGTVSRNIKTLSHSVAWHNKVAVPRGYGLLRTMPCVDNPRVLAVYLTGQGKAFVEEVARVFNGGYEDDRKVVGADRRSVGRQAQLSQ